MHKKRGFTLIELLVVIAIIGILAGIIVASLSSAKISSRDAKRISDLNSVRLALSLYYNDNLKYPATLATLKPTYIPAVPKDPNGSDYKYSCLMPGGGVCGAGSRYHLGAVMENPNNTALGEDADLAQNANGYAGSLGGATDFSGTSTDCVNTSGTELCYDLTGY
jgi:prepilin-type N-terminal cleavage/methylation domain-containing protein